MAKRQPDSKAISEARVQVAEIVGELRATKKRMLALSGRLKGAARTGEVLGTIVNDELTITLHPNGQPYTAEDWFADRLRVEAKGNESHLSDSIRELANLAREDHRESARFHVRSMNGEV
jgi:hypothetical protein